MNKKAEELGLENTHFVTPHGLDNENHYTTAYELAKLADYALNNKKIKELVGTKNYTVTVSGRSVNISNGNELLGNFIGVYGVKTGFTNGANRCLVTACEREGIDIISVVLGADTKNIRTTDSKTLLNYIFQNFKHIDLENKINKYFMEWQEDNFIEVEKGIEDYLDLKLGNIKYSKILVNNDAIDDIQINIECEKILKAPVYTNTEVGELSVYLNGKEILQVDILVENTVNSKEVRDYLIEILQKTKIYMLKT